MTNARRLVAVAAFLTLVGVVSFTHGQATPQTAAPPSVTPPPVHRLSTPAQERAAADKAQNETRFSKGGVFTYRPGKDEQLFAVALKPNLPASAVKGRDFLIMISVSATQAGEGWLASMRIAESIVEAAGPNDRVSLWSIGTPAVTKSLLPAADGFLSPKDPEHLKKITAAIEKLKTSYPAGDTDLKGGIAKAVPMFDGPESKQRILLFLGDGQSTHNPIDGNDRFVLSQELVARKVGFFAVPLGVRVHPENLHGLATGTGGMVLRTRVGEELLVDCMKRYEEAFRGTILYDAEVVLPASVKLSYPTKMPPLRADASTLVVGSMSATDAKDFRIVDVKNQTPANAGSFKIQVKGTPVGAQTPVTIDVAETVQPPKEEHFFLVSLVEQWKNAKDRPALLRGDRSLGIAQEQTKLNREELLITAENAIKDLKLDEAARAFGQVKLMAPHDREPDAGLRLVDRIKKGDLSPDAMKRVFEKRVGDKLENGQVKHGAVVQLAMQDEQDAKQDNVPAPGKQERNDLLQQHRDLRIVQEQKWKDIVDNTLTQGRKELAQDPDGTVDALRNILSRVQDNPELSDAVRTALATRLSTALREAKAQATTIKVRKEENQRNATVLAGLVQRQQQNRTLEQRQEEQLRNFRSQIEVAYFDEATKANVLANLLALQTENRLRGRPWPLAAQADYEMVLAGYNLEKSKEYRRQSEDRFLATMLALDKSFIPFPDEPGIAFPKLATWKQMTKYRKEKYEIGYIPNDPKGKEQADSMLKLLEEDIEIPDAFKQPVPFGKVLQFVVEKFEARGRELPVFIDKNAFKEGADDAPDILETTIQFPTYLRVMPMAVAMRLALSQISNEKYTATYIIRARFLEITTAYRAMIDKVIRVHPVADLTIPISQTGAQQQFGQAGRSQIGIGGGALGALGGQIGGIGGQIGGIGGIGGVGALGGGLQGGFQPGSALGGTSGSFNGGTFTGGFSGSLGAVGGTQGMQELIKLVTIVVDPGHWYYVQQQSPFQQGINNAFNNQALGNLGGGAAAQIGALGGAPPGAGGPGGPPLPPGEGGASDLLDPRTNTIYPYMPALALVVRAQARTHTSLTGGVFGTKSTPPAMAKNEDRGLVPFQEMLKDNKKGQFANNNGAKDPKNPVAVLVAKEQGNVKGQPGKAMALQIDPKVWDGILAEPNIPAEMIIATAEALFEQKDKTHVAEFLKANLRRGVLVRPWVFEALAIALEASGGDADEVRRARLSAVALDPKDAEGFLEAARTMAKNGQHDRALAFCRQAALLEPNLVYSYDQALVYAEQSKDAKAMEWAATRLVSQDWPVNNQIMHLKAETGVRSLAASLDNKTDGEKLRAALQTLKQRDLVIHLTWETSQEAADLDFSVKEPTGTVCSYDQRQTPGGGTLLANDLKTPNKITYVAAQGFSGAYEITVRKLYGRPLFGRARLEIIHNLGTPNETKRLEIIDLNNAKTVSVRVEDGRRSEFAVVSPANVKKSGSTDEAAPISGYEKLRRLSYPETTGGGARAGAVQPAATPRPTPTVRTSATVGVGINGQNTTVAVQPQNLKTPRPVNLSVVPGSR